MPSALFSILLNYKCGAVQRCFGRFLGFEKKVLKFTLQPHHKHKPNERNTFVAEVKNSENSRTLASSTPGIGTNVLNIDLKVFNF
jgi:hypothetical protein